MNCEQADELMPLYVAGALRVAVAAALETHFAGCPLHDEALDELRATAYVPASQVEAVTLPPALKSRIMTAVREEARAAETPRLPRREPRLRPQTALAGALAVAVLALAGMFAWNLQLHSQSSDGNETFAGRLQGDGNASGAFYYTESLDGVVVVNGLTPLPGDKTYQVWATTGGQTISCGLLALADTGPAYARMTAEMKANSRIFVTVEPAGGSALPTGATVLSSRP